SSADTAQCQGPFPAGETARSGLSGRQQYWFDAAPAPDYEDGIPRPYRVPPPRQAGVGVQRDEERRETMSTKPTVPSDWTAAQAFKAPMEICWQFDYAISQEKLENLYRKAKQAQWDAEQQLDWSIPIDPSQPIIDEQRNFFLRMPFFKRLSQTQREIF